VSDPWQLEQNIQDLVSADVDAIGSPREVLVVKISPVLVVLCCLWIGLL